VRQKLEVKQPLFPDFLFECAMGDEPDELPRRRCGGNKNSMDGSKKALERLAAVVEAASACVDDEPIELDLFNMSLGGEGAERLVDALVLDTSCPVRVLNISSNKIGNSGAAAIAKVIEAGSPPLLSLDIRVNKISCRGAEHLGMSLRANSTLTSLSISSNDFGADAAAWIASALEVNTVLRTLAFDYNTMGDEGAEKMGSALAKNSMLATLLMRSSDMRAPGAASLACALEVNRTLTALDVSTNVIGDEGAEFFFSALRTNHVITRLDMFGCEVGPRNTAAVLAALKNNEECGAGPTATITADV